MIPAEYRDPLTAATMEALTRYLTEHVQGDVWDECPELLVLSRLDTGPSMILQAAAPLGVPDVVWTMAPAHRVLAVVGDALRQIGPPDLPGEPVGVTLLSEAWLLELPVDATPEQRREAERWCQTHSIADHPHGKEVKMVTAVDTAGYLYFLQWTRGAARPFTQVTRNDHPGSVVAGRIPDALGGVLDALLAVCGA